MEDPRFSHVANDPRFKPMPRHARKIKIDSRFQSMFTDRRFKVKYNLDKRGRRIKQTSSEDLQKYYDLEDSTLQDTKRKGKRKMVESESTDDSLSEEEEEEDEQEGKIELAEDDDEELGEDEEDGGSDSDSSSTDMDTDSLLDDSEENELHHGWGELDKDVPESSETSSRLAVCNMDWDHVSAQDLHVVLSSWQPRSGCVQSVTVYPSDFGLERMSKEEVEGPSELMKGDETEEEGEEYSQERLRQYQLNRLKYYYAVVKCDSVATAEHIYNECNGSSFENSGTVLDLRFIPDEMQFSDREPVSVATALTIPPDYEPPDFITSALQQSKVHLTWDATDHRRLKATMTSFSKENLLDMDFSAYLASSSGEEEEEEEQDGVVGRSNGEVVSEEEQIQKYRALLGVAKTSSEKDHTEDQDVEMQFTWSVGFQEKENKQKTGKKDAGEKEGISMTKASKSKTKHRKLKGDTSEKVESGELTSDPSGFDDPFFTSSTTKPKKHRKLMTNEEKQAEQKEKSELELLMLSDTEEDGRQHFSLKKILESEKQELKKGKKKRRNRAEAKVADTFQVDLSDPRFSAIYDSHLYAVDPSDPHYKPTKGMEAIITEKQRRRQVKNTKEVAGDKERKDVTESSTSMLVKSVKLKTARFKRKKLHS